ncbi:uncharacterized protein LOC100278193 [Zea mays]|uniref:Myb/SANT-like domain-containing protein n=1 Tax=Zea mays TaxID=4577 RepID=B6U547_MAIZE|nr:uncharacterized protein LOC100278193 [Zea mays]ACG44480.1 hypothetical protein [Zea mays]|eukprot:NP_001145022.1 uncharacterized protein LOC100278193 [Zea mays]
MADKADWCDANVRHFIDVCKGEIDAGNRPMGMFTKTGWKNLRTKHEEKTGQKLTKKQLKNKLDNMKKEYTWFMEFKNYATGLGWDEAKQTVDCSKEWWDEHLARCNNPGKGIKCNHVRFRKQGPKHLDDLHIPLQGANYVDRGQHYMKHISFVLMWTIYFVVLMWTIW